VKLTGRGAASVSGAKRSELHKVGEHSDDAKADVIFVHGLGGDSQTTWMLDRADVRSFWPAWLAEARPDLNVWSLDYPAAPSAWFGHGMAILDAATSLLDRLPQYGVGARSVLFVVHSLGGLVVKQMLKTAWESRIQSWRAVLTQTRGIAFLATPHTGASLASFLGDLSKAMGLLGLIALRRQRSLRDLAAHDVHLGALNDWYRDRSAELQISSLVYREDVPVKGVLMVVDPSSANPGLPDVRAVPIARDHFGICKPVDRDDQVFVGVRRFIENCLAPGQDLSAVRTFLFSDIEGSSRLWEQEPERMRLALQRHDALARDAVETQRGVVVKTTGDGVHAAFDDPLDALAATLKLQQALANPEATHGIMLAVRCGVHAGVVERRDNDFFGSPVNRAARIMAAAHGGQVLLSQAIVSLVGEHLPAGMGLRDLGVVRLRDLTSVEHVFQLLHPQLRGDFPALRTLEATPNNLPLQLTSFVGRKRELTEVEKLLGTTRLLTLVGVGGIGKTRLSLQLAASVMEQYTDGVWLVELGALADSRDVPLAVASVLSVTEEAGQPLAEALFRFAKDRKLLLILDNCEHLLHACAELAKHLLQAGPNVRVLASSRESLHVFGETSYSVPPLAVPKSDATIALADLEQFEAANLFIDRARSAHPAIQWRPQNVVAVADICRRLDGIPLALELAAARVRALSVETIAARLNDRFSLLARGDTTALPRQQTLRATIDWSFELLTERERALLQRLAVFAGGCTLEAAEAVGAGGDVSRMDVLGLLANLVDKSLVTREAEGERYRLLETVRQYADERLNESGEADQVHRRHLEFFLAIAEQASSKLVGADQGAWLARLDLEAENLLAAHAECDQAENGGELGLRLVFSVKLYLIYRGLLALLQRVTLEALARPGAQGRTLARCRALHAAAQVESFTGRYQEAHRYLEQSLSIAKEIDDKERAAIVLDELGVVCMGQGELVRARRYLEEALLLAVELGKKRAMASVLNSLAQLDRVECSLDAAEQRYEQVLSLTRELEDQEPIAISLLNLAMVAIGRGSRDRAVASLAEALAIAETIGSRRAGQSGLEVTGGLHASRQAWERAAILFGAAEAHRTQTGLRGDAADEAFLAPLTDRTREALGERAFARAMATGRTLSYEVAITQARASLEGHD
jgi:predicted ATPase/class 3 adenylate cyclase